MEVDEEAASQGDIGSGSGPTAFERTPETYCAVEIEEQGQHDTQYRLVLDSGRFVLKWGRELQEVVVIDDGGAEQLCTFYVGKSGIVWWTWSENVRDAMWHKSRKGKGKHR